MEKVRPTDEKATYLATLYGKALDADLPNSILGDRWAAEAVRRMDFDFTTLGVPSGSDISLPLRALRDRE